MDSPHGPTVSAVIPAFRAESVIGRAVQSIIEQSHPVTEILIVDDASDDRTSDVVRQLSRSDDRIRLIVNPKNLGPGQSRNIAWNESKCDFIAFLDADDTWERDKIRLQLDWFDRHPDSVLCATSHRISTDDMSGRQEPEFSTFSVGDLLIRNRFTTPSVMLRRTISERFNEEARLSEDYLLWIEIAARHHGVQRINRQLTVLHKPIYGASGLSSRGTAMFRGELKTFALLREIRIVSRPRQWVAVVWSTLKFVRRIPTSYFRQKKWEG